jgi:hypothetical protein
MSIKNKVFELNPFRIMKIRFLSIFNKSFESLNNSYLRLSQIENAKKLPYNSLSPINHADRDDNYCEALAWALKNRKKEDIKNIAIAGPFGSGKSSIIKTFQARNKDRNLRFLNISLTNFKENEPNSTKDDLPRLIELSILQQIFYHEEDNNIPDSRFRKIKSFKRFDLISKTIGALIFILSVINLFFHTTLLKYILESEFNLPLLNLLHYSSILILTLGISIVLYNSIRFLHSLKVSKLKIEHAEIEVDEKVNKSVLNHHLDEILYFFEVTNYNVVIIEDLDRFGQTEIFAKLREINLLINNSEKIKNDVVFIYAIRDDMFVDNDRTKFFDFVIPIIPVINSSNSNEMLLAKKNSNKFDVSNDLIENISLFIDDMRLLHNIVNEYYIYHLNLDKKLNQDKLLAIIVYKNIHPNDFTKLSCNDGILYKTINSKKKYISEESNKIEITIQEINSEIKELEAIKIKDIKELRSLYVLRYIVKLNGFKSFIINSERINTVDILEDDNFEYLIEDNVLSYNYWNAINDRILPKEFLLKFEDIEKEVDSERTYLKRKALIDNWNKNRLEILKRQLETLEKNKLKLKALPIKELIHNSLIENKPDNKKQGELITILLRNGYIEEDYLEYISIFYEGSITKSDHQFLLNIKSQIPSDFDFNLFKIDKLITKINPFDFEKEYILNYKLLSYLLQNNMFKQQRNNIFNLLKSESNKVLQFIDGFIETGNDSGIFFKDLCKYWVNIWNYVSIQSVYTEEKKNKYFVLIIEHATIEDIISISKVSNLTQFISEKNDILSLKLSTEKLQNVIASLEIKFISLDITNAPNELINFLLEGWYYDINIEMIKLFLKSKGNFNQGNFDTKNYYTIKTSNCNELLAYINSQINKYITNVYLKIPTNLGENEACLIELLNMNELTAENKGNLIKTIQTKIIDLSEIDDPETCDILMENSKVESNWDNIIHHYEINDSELLTPLINFINQFDNASVLSESKLPKDEEGVSDYQDFMVKLLKSEINDSSYDLILKSIPYSYNLFNFDGLTYSKVELLIKNGKLLLITDNFIMLKENFKDLHIKLIEEKKNLFLLKINDFNVDQEDVFLLLSSRKLTDKEKNLIVKNIQESTITSNPRSVKLLGELINRNSSFSISESLLNEVLGNNDLSTIQKIDIFYAKHRQLNKNDITEFLNSLGKPYSDIALYGKMPLISDIAMNRKLVELLFSLKYISRFKNEKKGIRILTFRK